MIVVRPNIQMDINIHVIFVCQLEDSRNLARPVTVVARRATDGFRTALQALNQIGIAFGHPGPAFLQEHTKIEINPPGVILGELLERIETLHADIRIEFHMGAHMGDTGNQRGFQ